MSTKTEIIQAIQAVVDGLAPPDNDLRISMGAPGSNVPNIIGEGNPTGQAWLPEPTVFAVLIEGIADYMDGQGDIPTIVAKLNELIGEYNDFRDDYNNGIVPTSANAVLPIP